MSLASLERPTSIAGQAVAAGMRKCVIMAKGVAEAAGRYRIARGGGGGVVGSAPDGHR